jgi:hypothetical protein
MKIPLSAPSPSGESGNLTKQLNFATFDKTAYHLASLLVHLSLDRRNDYA